MNTRMDTTCSTGLRSPSQITRRVTESWARENLYCVACEADRVTPLPHNSKARDFTCAKCSAAYQLKSLKTWSDRRVPDAGYDAMMQALRSDVVPNLLVMQYTDNWLVHRLLLIPSFFFSPSAVERRKPLTSTARRDGWIGCNILLSEIAEDGKIPVILQGAPVAPAVVREQYEAVRPLAEIHTATRGWTLDVLRMVRRLGQRRFALNDMYAYERDLCALYPNNRNVRAKIRQQLQVLRDLGFIGFEGKGWYYLQR